MNFASGFTPLVGAGVIFVGPPIVSGGGRPGHSLGFGVSQHGHLLCLAWFVTEHDGHFQLPGATFLNLSSGFTPLDNATGADTVLAA